MGDTVSGRILVSWDRTTQQADPVVELFRAGMAGKLVLSLEQTAWLMAQIESVMIDIWLRSPVIEGDTYLAWIGRLRGAREVAG